MKPSLRASAVVFFTTAALSWAARPGAGPAGSTSVRGVPPGGKAGILFHLTEHTVRSSGARGSGCYSMSFLRFLDAGYLRPDGRVILLELKDNPTSKVVATTTRRYFYTSSPSRFVRSYGPVMAQDWNAPGQSLWSAPFSAGPAEQLAAPSGGSFPGDVAAAPGGRYVVYPLTHATSPRPGKRGVPLFPKFDPFATDSSLAIRDLAGGTTRTVLNGSYNRRLFTSFSDFSPDGKTFYTVARQGAGFRFVTVDLATGKVRDFRDAFPRGALGAVPWSELFPHNGKDFNFASFSISPDRRRLAAHRDAYARPRSPSCAVAAFHDTWIFPLDGGTALKLPRRKGYVSSLSWEPDGSRFAMAVVSASGCYPSYIDSAIVLHDRNGTVLRTLANEPRSKIITIGWSPDGRHIAYDVYGTDFVGRLKVADVASGAVRELLDTVKLGHAPDRSHPVVFLFAGWVPLR